jgi:hypothetical protein
MGEGHGPGIAILTAILCRSIVLPHYMVSLQEGRTLKKGEAYAVHSRFIPCNSGLMCRVTLHCPMPLWAQL